VSPIPGPPRSATLVLCTTTGDVLGRLPSFETEPPWWQDAAGIVTAAREHYGVEVTIIRLLEASRPAPPGGAVTYLAQLEESAADDLPLVAWAGALEPHPLRLPYAEPGGPQRDLAWATGALAEQGIARRGAAQQVRTWNLSSLWRIPVADGSSVWLKSVPPFFAHEGDVMALLQDGPVPRLLAHSPGRILMPEIGGGDLYGAPTPILLSLVTMLVGLQAWSADRLQELAVLGLPDWRGAALTEAVEDVVRRNSAQLADENLVALGRLVDGAAAGFAAIAECGVPDSLVHGDFAPGNARGDADRQTLLDWGDCGIGHPLLDRSAFMDRIGGAQRGEVEQHWDETWRTAMPGSDPARAARLLAPWAAARQAVIYQGFLDNIEPSEHPYHRSDPAEWLTRAAALVSRAFPTPAAFRTQAADRSAPGTELGKRHVAVQADPVGPAENPAEE
jgi:phosphotransferase family enzyme